MNSSANIAILIKTCSGRPSIIWTLKSVKFALTKYNFRFYISDEEPIDSWKHPVYERLKCEGHHIEVHENGISCGRARNGLVDALLDEEYVLRLDDDFELGGEFDIKPLLTTLKVSDEIGYCSDFERQLGNNKGVRSGSIRPAGGDFYLNTSLLVKKFHSPFRRFQSYDGTRYSLADHTRNLMLIKRRVVDDVKWDEDLLFEGEHEDFMLSIREAGYRGAYTPDSIHYHRDDLAWIREGFSGHDQADRRGLSVMKKIFSDKWGVDEVATKYPLSWYAVEASRRVVAKILD